MIQLSDLKNKVIELATAYPNAKYCRPGLPVGGGCHYAKGNVENGPETPGCVIGQALRLLDNVTFNKFYDFGGTILGMVKNHDYFNGTDDESNWLFCFQCKQDSGKTWSECLKIANSTT